MRPDQPSATIDDIARLAGVSVASVSRALNGRPGVSEATRKAIARIAEENHYTGNESARALSLGRSGRVAVALPYVHAEYFARILSGAASVFQAAGLSIMLETTSHQHEAQVEAVRHFRQAGIDGALLLLPPENQQELKALSDTGFPFIVVDSMDRLTLTLPWITGSHTTGAMDATNHLLKLGHRRIGIITGEPQMLSTVSRLHGVRQALADAQLPLEDELVINQTYRSQADGYEGAMQLLTSARPPSAIFAFNDILAFGVLRAAHELGIIVPQQLSVVGFDDQEAASMITPALTTVRQPLNEMGSLGADLLIRAIGGEKLTAMHIQLPTELIVRGSTAEYAAVTEMLARP